ncbi:MAG TPA: hypothetical protein VK468_09250 [Pyrinomonadaceae bacterium]|nr:hypothetical protein [Pyrinomonadaceae bacterium]
MQTLEAIVDSTGTVRLLTDAKLPKNRRALVTILDEEPKFAGDANKKKLLAAFRKAQEAGLFNDIEDPSEWQRNLRDEWD